MRHINIISFNIVICISHDKIISLLHRNDAKRRILNPLDYAHCLLLLENSINFVQLYLSSFINLCVYGLFYSSFKHGSPNQILEPWLYPSWKYNLPHSSPVPDVYFQWVIMKYLICYISYVYNYWPPLSFSRW